MAEADDTSPTRSVDQRVVAGLTASLIAFGLLRHPYGPDGRRVAPRYVIGAVLALLLAVGLVATDLLSGL